MARQKLIDARKSAGLTQEQVAQECDVERATYGTWERGERSPQPQQREKLALALGVTLSEVHSMLSNFAQEDGKAPLELKLALAIEQAATKIRAHELSVVYGLLQTPAYAAAIARAVGTGTTADEYVERNIEQRRHRQQRVLRGDVQLHILQPEAALRSRLGGETVMVEQMHRIGELAALDNVTVQILPFDVGQYEAQRVGIFSISTLPWATTPTVDLDVYGGLRLIDDPEEVAYFQDAFDHAARLALSPKASVRFIENLADEWENRR
jgi:transcriptional regulator with XRE-family HTH domain